jgi:hypothetical protein
MPFAKEDIALLQSRMRTSRIRPNSGELLSDRLVISGPIIQATLRYELEVVDGGDSLNVTLQIGRKPDYPLHKQGRGFIGFGETVFCLGVRYSTTCYRRDTITGLALRATLLGG